jgi:photosystem II stability/assembly factor-like uncharacterized protein
MMLRRCANVCWLDEIARAGLMLISLMIAGCERQVMAPTGPSNSEVVLMERSEQPSEGPSEKAGVPVVSEPNPTTGVSGATGTSGEVIEPPPPFVPPTCSNVTLPADAPTLVPGQWVQLPIEGIPFNTPDGSFTQGMTTDPCNPATLYVCVVGFGANAVPHNGLYRSLNAGKTWTRLGPMTFPVRVRVDPRDPLHLYVADGVSGSQHGFWVSKDGGNTWYIPDEFQRLAASELSFDTYHVEPDPADFNHVLVTFHSGWRGAKYNGNSGVIESFDGGEHWTIHEPIGSTFNGGYNVYFLYEPVQGIGNNRTWLFATQGGGTWRTTDAGQQWTRVSTVNMDHGGGTHYYSANGTLYVSGSPYLLRSDNNGASFTELKPAFGNFLTVIGDGTHLYAGQHFGGDSFTALEANDTEWSTVQSSPPAFRNAGPFEYRFDPHNRIVYAAQTGAGVWALKVP